MKLCSIASGSSGNCIFAGSEMTSLMIDTGISGKRIEEGLNVIGHTDVDFNIGDITVSPIAISHDAAQPTAYILRQPGKSMAVMTDLGKYDSYIVDKLQNLDVLLLEANHDVHMLQVGAYPYYLKQRILGERGHLSNEVSGQLLSEILHDNFKTVILGHLSKENNYEKLAYETVRLELDMADNPYRAADFPIQVAKRDSVSQMVEI